MSEPEGNRPNYRAQEQAEQDQMDRLLRASLGGIPPALPPSFEQRLHRRLRPRKLDAAGKQVLWTYSVLALLMSAGSLRLARIGWTAVAGSILGSGVLGSIVVGQSSRSTDRRRNNRPCPDKPDGHEPD